MFEKNLSYMILYCSVLHVYKIDRRNMNAYVYREFYTREYSSIKY